MKKIFLASSFSDVANIFASINGDLKDKTVTFIPTASLVETVTFYVNTGRKALVKLGLIVEDLEISTATSDEIKNKLTNNDFIYVTGGNTFFLLQELKRTGADKIIVEEVNSGKIYIGESAGAIVASVDIGYAQKMDSVDKAPALKDYNALGLVDFYTVPHYKSVPFKKVAQSIIDTYEATLNLSPISNKDAIWVQDDKMQIHSQHTSKEEQTEEKKNKKK
jgi:dipeptidase E